jgi:hypothetical protein
MLPHPPLRIMEVALLGPRRAPAPATVVVAIGATVLLLVSIVAPWVALNLNFGFFGSASFAFGPVDILTHAGEQGMGEYAALAVALTVALVLGAAFSLGGLAGYRRLLLAGPAVAATGILLFLVALFTKAGGAPVTVALGFYLAVAGTVLGFLAWMGPWEARAPAQAVPTALVPMAAAPPRLRSQPAASVRGSEPTAFARPPQAMARPRAATVRKLPPRNG